MNLVVFKKFSNMKIFLLSIEHCDDRARKYCIATYDVSYTNVIHVSYMMRHMRYSFHVFELIVHSIRCNL